MASDSKSLELLCSKTTRNMLIHEYEINSEKDIPIFEYTNDLIEHFKKDENMCLVAGNRMFLTKKVARNDAVLNARFSPENHVRFSFCKSIRLKNHVEFFQILLQRITDYLNDHGGR
jgi:hypothetical protein